MNKSESKYFATAAKMDEAFLQLLEKKDFAYITVKEICASADVNRSTFYLHYETISDLLAESVRYMNQQFMDYMAQDKKTFAALPVNGESAVPSLFSKLQNCPKEKLCLVTPEYLTPYLNYIREHKRLFCTAMQRANVLNLDDTYGRMFTHVFTPILERYNVPQEDRCYLMAFYISGLMAIISEWLKHDCSDSIEHTISVMQRCVMTHQEET